MQLRWIGWALGASVVVAASLGVAREDDEERKLEARPAPAPAMKMRAPTRMGATPGGAQDIDYARDRIQAGEVPHPNTFTPEGLFSQYDLPLQDGRKCTKVLCLAAAATRSDLLVQPEVKHLAQLGFSSSFDASTWRREPLNLVAVVDKSGSMDGAPLETVKASLRQVARQMTARDQLSVVLYGDTSHVHLPPTSLAERERVLASIDRIQSAGSTAMEEGLRVGYDLARRSRAKFRGATRVMLFTDERPNVGATEADSFMAMARQASADGVGLTTVGVGTHFGAELATAISSVRGGNLVFFPNPAQMRARFEREFDTLVTELAHDFKLTIKPRAGIEIAGVYGLPGDLIRRVPGGGLELTVETIFLSRDQGGIFFAFKPAGAGALPPAKGPLADASVSYVDTKGNRQSDRVSFAEWTGGELPLGLRRGQLLVDEITTLKRAASLHQEHNETEQAFRLVRALKQRFQQSPVTGLAKERALVARLDETLTRLSGHRGEAAPTPVRRDRVSGLPQ
ncbi:MAG TPA: VWA domain-containing protein [Polyangiaceae bacterium]|nr:VWA domain-containing protein [Polyangiaceae bacterium]